MGDQSQKYNSMDKNLFYIKTEVCTLVMTHVTPTQLYYKFAYGSKKFICNFGEIEKNESA